MREDTRLGTPARGPSEIQPDDDDERGDWAPVVRLDEHRGEVVDFRTRRVMVPASLAEAFGGLALALEFYEHAREIERDAHEAHAAHIDAESETRERAIGYLLDADEKAKVTTEARAAALKITGERSASSRTAAEKLVDLVPFVAAFNAETRRLHRAKLDAEKEVSVARRRHDTIKLFVDRLPIVEILERVQTQAVRIGTEPRDPAAVAREIVDEVNRHAARGGWQEYPRANTGAELEIRSGAAPADATEAAGDLLASSGTPAPESDT